MKVHRATILQLVAAPGRLADEYGNIYAGYALVELNIRDEVNGQFAIVRDILPFDTQGGLIGLPAESYYLAHGLGDERPSYAEFFGADGLTVEPVPRRT